MIRNIITSIDDTVDLEDFYEQDKARLLSEEILFGSTWTDEINSFYELSWIVDTGELYLMIFPDHYLSLYSFGKFMTDDEVKYILDMTVIVIAIVNSESEIKEKLLAKINEIK